MSLKQSQIALSNFAYFKHSLRYALDSLQRLGAKAIELYACDPHFHLDDSDLPQVMALKKMLRDRGLNVICITPEQVKYPLNIASTHPVTRMRSMQTYIKAIQYASELECPTVQFFAGWGPLDEPLEKVWPRSVDSLGYLATIAEGYGITITIEAVDRTQTVLTGTDKIAQMLEEINSPNLYGMIDTVCLKICNETIEDAIRNITPEKLRHFHFSDVIMESPEVVHIIPGEGNMDLDHVLNELDKIGYKHYLSLELMSPYEYRAEEATRKGAEWMRARMT